EVLVLAIEHTDSGRTIELVAGESVEVAIDLAHVDIEVHGSLGAVEQHRDAARVSDAGDFLRRNHGAQHIDICVIATSLVRGVSSFSNSSTKNRPSSS